MNKINFYLAGAMGGLSFEEQTGWRNKIINAIKTRDLSSYFFNPPYYYQPNGSYHTTEREAMEFDLYRLRKSDVVIVNLDYPNSIGTIIEIAITKEHRIPVIALHTKNDELHPWLNECCTRICKNIDELIEHIINFYLT